MINALHMTRRKPEIWPTQAYYMIKTESEIHAEIPPKLVS